MWILITLAVATACGFVMMKIKFPGGMLVGAIIGVALLNVATGQAYVYSWAGVVAQAVTGAYIGCMMTRDKAYHLPKVIRPFLVVITALLVLNVSVGLFFYWLTNYDLMTCLFCATPGGMSETPLIAMDMGADGSVVAVMQFIRVLYGMGCLPGLILLTDQLVEPEVSHQMDEKAKSLGQKKATGAHSSTVRFLPIFAVALAAGFLGRWSGMPAGSLAVPFLTVSVLNICGLVPPMPMWMRRVAQVLSGCCIGATITLAHVLQMRQLVIPAVVLCLGYSLCCVGVGLLVAKVFHISLREAMLCLAPAGASDMALIAADLGVESVNLVVLQMGRLVVVSLVFPHVFELLVGLLG